MELFRHFDDFPPRRNPQIPESKTPRHKRVMRMLKDSIFTTLKASNPSSHISRALKSHIVNQMHEFSPSFATPTHPPYASMIETAIMELNEEGGSNEESISGFIEKNYESLPWGHASFLSHHLRKLCGTGEIVCKSDGRYTIYVGESGVEKENHVEGQENEMINEWNTVRRKQVVVFEEQHQVEKTAAEASEQEVEEPSNQQLMENSHSFGELEERRVDLEVEQHQHARILCTSRVSDAKMIGGGKLLRDHDDRFMREENRTQEHCVESETEILGLCCVNRGDHTENLWVSLGDCSLNMLKERRKQSVKEEQLRMRNIWEERKSVIVCGLGAQQQADRTLATQAPHVRRNKDGCRGLFDGRANGESGQELVRLVIKKGSGNKWELSRKLVRKRERAKEGEIP